LSYGLWVLSFGVLGFLSRGGGAGGDMGVGVGVVGLGIWGSGSGVQGSGFMASDLWVRANNKGWTATSSHRKFSLFNFRKSTPPQNRQLIVCYYQLNIESTFFGGG